MRIGLAYNQKPETGHRDRGAHSPPLSPDTFAEWDEPATIDAVERALRAFGNVVRLEAVADFPARLAAAKVDLLFNMAEGWSGPNREAHVPAIAEFLGVPYTASDPLALTLALHKGRAKEVLAYRGIPTAPFVVLTGDADLPRLDALPPPLFLKPVWEGSSKGIDEGSYASDVAQARQRARALLEQYDQPVLAECWLPGDEFTVAVMGNGADAHCLPLIRFRFESLPGGALPIMGYEAKWLWDRPEQPLDVLECPAAVSDARARAVADTALAAYHALGCRDWARVDLRLDAAGVPNIVEVNPLPGIIPDPADNSCFPRAAAAAGMSYDELIQSVVRIAWKRITGREPAAAPVEAIA